MFEIERKFLVQKLPELKDFSFKRIAQGYIITEGEEAELRLREENGVYLQTVKRGRGLTRMEAEIEITGAQFELLWPHTAGKRISKTRYNIPYRRWIIELDVYHGPLAGLIIAEIEFKSEKKSAAFKKPEWFGREVTGTIQYMNQHLAVYGLPDIRNE